jgi:hypothetical protein
MRISVLFVVLCSFGVASLLAGNIGIVTGGIYQGVPLSFQTNALNIFCEFKQLGVSWIRIQSDWPGTDISTYQSIVQIAHANYMPVIVIVPAQYCGSDSDTAAIDQFTSTYTAHLDYLRKNVFVGSAQVDAYEIANEPNIYEAACTDGQSRFRVSPNAFAYLCRRSYEYKQRNSIPEKIVTGGILNTYTTESFWSSFFASGAFTQYPGQRFFDYFGIHPYDPYSIDTNCVNSGSTNCFSSWGSTITSGLQTVASQVDSATRTSGTTLFVTEIGLQTRSSCSPYSNCVINTQQQSTGMQTAFDSISRSGRVAYTLWYTYRDDYPYGETFGIRSSYNGTRYPAKQPTWSTFQRNAGGSGSSVDICW